MSWCGVRSWSLLERIDIPNETRQNKQRTREGTPVIGLLGDVKLQIDRELEKRTFNFAISVLIV